MTPLHGIACFYDVGFGARAVSRKTPIYFMLYPCKQLWFEKFFFNPPNNPLTVRSLENTGANYFSQPHSEIIANRINFFSQ